MKDMTPEQKEFLQLSVVEQINYADIEKRLGIPRKTFAPWWDELKTERLYLTKIRDLKKKKCPELSFYEFKNWYETAEKKCHYCNLSEENITALWEKNPLITKRPKRGKSLEIERKQPNLSYNEIENLVFSCYWCNNAKTDTFTEDEFKQVGKVFQSIWEKRLK